MEKKQFWIVLLINFIVFLYSAFVVLIVAFIIGLIYAALRYFGIF